MKKNCGNGLKNIWMIIYDTITTFNSEIFSNSLIYFTINVTVSCRLHNVCPMGYFTSSRCNYMTEINPKLMLALLIIITLILAAMVAYYLVLGVNALS